MRFFKYAIVLSTCLLVQGCGSVVQTLVSIQDFSFGIPTTMQAVSSASLDSAQISHNILGARKDTTSNLVLSESSIPSSITLQIFTDQARARIAQDMIWYSNGSVSSTSFTCNGTKVPWYIHSFSQTDPKDSSKTIMYYQQFYFIHNASIYILSLAQTDQKNILSTTIDSLTCKK